MDRHSPYRIKVKQLKVYNLRVLPSLPTHGFWWDEICPSKTMLNFLRPSWHRSLVLQLGPCAFDIHFRCMIWCTVGAPGATCWRDPWHLIFHIWNQHARDIVETCHMKTWAGNCASQHWKFVCCIMRFFHERWVRRMLHWQPFGVGIHGKKMLEAVFFAGTLLARRLAREFAAYKAKCHNWILPFWPTTHFGCWNVRSSQGRICLARPCREVSW